MRRVLWLVMMLWPAGLAAQCAIPAAAAGMVQDVYAGVNAQRTAAGLAPLAPVAELALAVQGHACDMAMHGIRNHTGANGSAVDQRVRRAGFRPCVTSENIAWGFRAGARAVAFWMQSEGHRRNMMSHRVRMMGVGVAQGSDGPQLVLVMARPC